VANGNPFMVQPGYDITPGLQGLSGIINQVHKLNQFREAQKKQLAEENNINSLFEAIQNPNKIIDIAQKRNEFLQSMGMEPDEDVEQLAARYQEDPEGLREAFEQELAFRAPKRYASYKQATIGSPSVESTKDIKNFNFYKTLLRENPEAAAEFAQQSGITKPVSKTDAIKEFEYSLENPQFALNQQAKANEQAAKEAKKQQFKDVGSLRKEYLGQSKDYQKVRDAYTRVLRSTESPSPAGDLSLIFNYMKMLDPGSVVRESEFATAASAGSYGERIQAAANRIINGERLSPEMRADFLSKSETLFEGMENQHEKLRKTYKSIARQNKLPQNQVVIDIGLPGDEDIEEEEILEKEQGGMSPQLTPVITPETAANLSTEDLMKRREELLRGQ